MKRLRSGASITVFDSLDSTSAEAKRQAANGETGPSWFVALRQTDGYGRRGRVWRQQEGDFAGSLLLSPPEGAPIGELSFVAALAIHDTTAALLYAQSEGLRLKWPNDLLLAGAKLSGMLLEMTVHGEARAIIIGIGVNVISKPDADYPTARLIDYMDTPPPAPSVFAERLDANFWKRFRAWRTEGFSSIREDWLARAAGIGEPITVRLPSETLVGEFETINPDGGLVLRSRGGTRIIHAGEVFFGRPNER